MAHTIYKRLTPSGATLRQIVGFPFSGAETGTIGVSISDTLLAHEYPVSLPGDLVRDDLGAWWVVTIVGPVADGLRPLTLEAPE